jgi:Rieske Fe-S protein
MQRREFIKSSCAVCFSGIAVSSLFTACSTLPLVKINSEEDKILVPAEKMLNTNAILLRTSRLPYDILLQKKAGSTYTALYLKCTHQDQPLVATEKTIYCTSHGSAFDMEGNVLKEPALKTLEKFSTSVKDNMIYIHLKNKL